MMPLERTRALIARKLRVEIVERDADAYRDHSMSALAGEWIGAFVQPSVVLHSATALSAELTLEDGKMTDEYGPSSIRITRADHDRVELEKCYANGQPSLIYIGRLSRGSLAGVWYSSARPRFCGVFWMARTDRLSVATVDALRAQIRSSSRRKLVLVGAAGVVGGALALGTFAAQPIAFAMLGVMGGFAALFDHRRRTLGREVQQWRELLGLRYAAVLDRTR